VAYFGKQFFENSLSPLQLESDLDLLSGPAYLTDKR
jgi:hypothetical protein